MAKRETFVVGYDPNGPKAITWCGTSRRPGKVCRQNEHHRGPCDPADPDASDDLDESEALRDTASER